MSSSDLRQRIQRAIDLLQSQREALGDDVVELALRPLLEQQQRLTPGSGSGGNAPQLRHLSVLFCDVVGSTSLSQYLSPEAVSAVMDDALAAFTHLAQLHGGSVLSYAGDSMLAVFGAPVAREDDAARAVRSGLAILGAARARAQEVLDRHGHPGFNVRAGVATGGVLLGGGVDGDSSARGMTVNLAARMEQTAQPGTLRVCPDTWRQLRGRFEGDEQPPLMVKGRDEPIRTWLVTGERRGSAAVRAGVAGLAVPMLGRSAEQQVLQQAFIRFEPAGSLTGAALPPMQQIIVLGDTGLGKSRLAAEFRAWAQQRDRGVRWFTAVATEADAQRPYGLLRRGFARFAQLRDSDPPETARHNWLAAFAPLLRSQGDAAVLGHLLGLDFSAHDEVRPMLDEAQQLRDRAFHHALQALQAMAVGGSPLVVLLDDLHLADRGTLDFLDHLLARASALPLLMVGLGRPILRESHPSWLDQPAREVMSLQPLAADEAAVLAATLLAPLHGEAPSLLERLLAAAGGNPFYMEEWVQVLLDRGVLVDEGERWRLNEDRLASWPVPGTLRGVLEARLDELDPEVRSVLLSAAVIGAVFWDDALAALGHPQAGDALAELQQRQFIIANDISNLEGRFEYAFRHQTLHQVAYERVLERDRVTAHARVARWLAGLPGDKPLDRIAEHYERGGEPALACTAWLNAAQAAQVRYANEQALAHADRALALTPQNDLMGRYKVLIARQRVLAHLLRVELLVVTLDDLERIADELNQPALQAEVSDWRARWSLDQGHVEGALVLALQSWDGAKCEDPQQAARSGVTLVNALGQLGRYGEAEKFAEEAVLYCRRVGDRASEGAIFNALGVAADDQGNYSLAISWYSRALICHQESGNKGFEASVISNLGYVELSVGEYESADGNFIRAADMFSKIGKQQHQALVMLNRALIALNTKKPALAQQYCRLAEKLIDPSASRWMRAALMRVLGRTNSILGNHEEAIGMLGEACELYESLGLRSALLEARALLAEALARSGRGEAAVFAVEVLSDLERGQSMNGAEEPLLVYLICWNLLRDFCRDRVVLMVSNAIIELRARANRISDSSRRESFLTRVPAHAGLLGVEAELLGGIPAG